MKEKPQLKSKDLPKEEDEAKSESPPPPTRSSIGGRSGGVAAEPGRGRMGWGWLFECRVCCLVEGKSQCFKNRTGPAGPTGPTVDRSPFRSGPAIWPVKRLSRNRTGWTGDRTSEPDEPAGSLRTVQLNLFSFCFCFFPPSIRVAVPMFAGHWSVVPLAAAPARWKALPRNTAKPHRRPLNPPSPAVVPIVAGSVWNIEKFWRYFSKIVELGFVKFKSIGIKAKRPLEQIRKTQGAKKIAILLVFLWGFERIFSEIKRGWIFPEIKWGMDFLGNQTGVAKKKIKNMY